MEGIIILIILLFGFYCIKKYTKNLSKGCCGSGDTLIRESITIDKNLYPYKTTYTIEGMTCENCAAIIERRLNKELYKGVIDFKNHLLTIHSKKEISYEEIKEIVENAGFHIKK